MWLVFAAALIASGLCCRASSAQNYNYYGSAMNADALSNIRIGPYGLQADYRIEAQHTGYVSAVRFYLIVKAPKPGYAGGNGGKLLVQLQTDDGTVNHNPSGHSLASYLISSPQAGYPSPYASFRTISFSSQPYLQGGKLYHLVFSNTDADPSVNYVSVDNLYMYHPASQMQPLFSNAAFCVLIRSTGRGWSEDANLTPIVELDFSNGNSQGSGYMEVWAGNPKPIGGGQQVREAITVARGNKYFAQAFVRVARVGGSGSLTVRVEQSNGTAVGVASIPASSVPLSSTSSPNYVWVRAQFSSSHILFQGDAYHLVLQAPSGTTYQTFPIRKGSYNNYFGPGTYFHEGCAEVLSSGQWVGWDMWGATNRLDSDLQFYIPLL
ncbi:MAG TPA: hypothetical protein VN661_02140 [Candidatus Acidoferrales bacterium]|nr:hypothetical protein [Candidatus Acidoferrales bacterium]